MQWIFYIFSILSLGIGRYIVYIFFDAKNKNDTEKRTRTAGMNMNKKKNEEEKEEEEENEACIYMSSSLCVRNCEANTKYI